MAAAHYPVLKLDSDARRGFKMCHGGAVAEQWTQEDRQKERWRELWRWKEEEFLLALPWRNNSGDDVCPLCIVQVYGGQLIRQRFLDETYKRSSKG